MTNLSQYQGEDMTCPHCECDLGDLDHIMDKLHQNKTDYSFIFEAHCCHKKIKAYRTGSSMYYIVGLDENEKEFGDHQMIGAA